MNRLFANALVGVARGPRGADSNPENNEIFLSRENVLEISSDLAKEVGLLRFSLSDLESWSEPRIRVGPRNEKRIDFVLREGALTR